jgi:probable RNA-binding protein EIF1AD
MPRKSSKRALSALDELTSVPPDSPLPPSQVIGRIVQGQGKNLFTCTLPSGEQILAELASIFRGTAWLRRGGYVLIDRAAFDERDNKIGGQVINVVRNERDWRKMDYWHVFSFNEMAKRISH